MSTCLGSPHAHTLESGWIHIPSKLAPIVGTALTTFALQAKNMHCLDFQHSKETVALMQQMPHTACEEVELVGRRNSGRIS